MRTVKPVSSSLGPLLPYLNSPLASALAATAIAQGSPDIYSWGPAALAVAASSRSARVRLLVAKRADAPVELLTALSKDSAVTVRRAASASLEYALPPPATKRQAAAHLGSLTASLRFIDPASLTEPALSQVLLALVKAGPCPQARGFIEASKTGQTLLGMMSSPSRPRADLAAFILHLLRDDYIPNYDAPLAVLSAFPALFEKWLEEFPSGHLALVTTSCPQAPSPALRLSLAVASLSPAFPRRVAAKILAHPSCDLSVAVAAAKELAQYPVPTSHEVYAKCPLRDDPDFHRAVLDLGLPAAACELFLSCRLSDDLAVRALRVSFDLMARRPGSPRHSGSPQWFPARAQLVATTKVIELFAPYASNASSIAFVASAGPGPDVVAALSFKPAAGVWLIDFVPPSHYGKVSMRLAMKLIAAKSSEEFLKYFAAGLDAAAGSSPLVASTADGMAPRFKGTVLEYFATLEEVLTPTSGQSLT